jgi:hypothetical protein
MVTGRGVHIVAWRFERDCLLGDEEKLGQDKDFMSSHTIDFSQCGMQEVSRISVEELSRAFPEQLPQSIRIKISECRSIHRGKERFEVSCTQEFA